MSQLPSVTTILDDAELGSDDDRAFAEDVQQHGFRWISVGQSEQDAVDFPEWRNVPGWSYTVGLYSSFGHSEFVAFDLDDDIVGRLFWDLADQIRVGRVFGHGAIYEDALPSFEGQRFALDPVSPAWGDSLFGSLSWFYKGSGVPILQYLWPPERQLCLG